MRIDYKCNDQIKKLAEEFTYNSGLSEGVKHDKALNSFKFLLKNFVERIVSKGDCTGILLLHPSHYTGDVIVNGRKTGRKVSYDYTRRALSWLEDNGFIHIKVGEVSSYSWSESNNKYIAKGKTKSSYELTLKFLYSAEDCISSYKIEPEDNVIKLRGDDKKDETFKMTPALRRKKDTLIKFNKKFIDIRAYVEDNSHIIQLNKIYNLSFQRGGRNYMKEGSFQNLPLSLRKECTLDMANGEVFKLAELDYKALHPSILYCKVGKVIPESFDPYYIKNIWGFDSEELRSIAKVALLILINSDNYHKALYALKYKMISDQFDSDAEGVALESIHNNLDGSDVSYEELAKVIIKSIKENNQGIKEFFHSGIGAQLMKTDADIMDYVLEYFLDKDIPVLLVHDSAAIRKDMVEELEQVMYDAYEKTVGTLDNCIIERKY